MSAEVLHLTCFRGAPVSKLPLNIGVAHACGILEACCPKGAFAALLTGCGRSCQVIAVVYRLCTRSIRHSCGRSRHGIVAPLSFTSSWMLDALSQSGPSSQSLDCET